MGYLLALIAMSIVAIPCAAQEIDGTQLSEQAKKELLIAPDYSDTLEVIAEGPAGDVREVNGGRYDITRVHFGNVAEGRWLWAIEFAEPYSYDNASVILYVDADNDPATGREGMGCETTYGHSGGTPSQMFYLPDERRSDFPLPRVTIEDGTLYICADLPLNQRDGRSVFRIQVLSEQRDPHESRDSLGWREVSGPGDTDRERVMTLADVKQGEGFDVTQDAALLWEINGDARNVIINSFQDCEAVGFAYNHSEYRWPAMRRTAGEGTLSAKAQAGRWHLAAVVYDGPGREVYELALDGDQVGTFIADADNNRQRLFFTPEAMALTGEETITLRAAGDGQCIVEDILLLAQRPEVRQPPHRLEHLEVGWDWDREEMRATWITTWPAACTLSGVGEPIVEVQPLQNHRVYLPDLEAGRRYTLAVDAAEAGAHEVTFTAGEPQIAPCNVARERINLSLLNDGRPLPVGYPLTAGVPFPQGALDSTDHLRLLADGAEAPLQTRPLVHWPDGSVKVALLDTIAPGADVALALEYGREVTRTDVAEPVTVAQDGNSLVVSAAGLTARFDTNASGLFASLARDGVAITDPDRPARITLVDDAGNVYDTLGAPDAVTVEEAGPLRTVVRLDGHHTGEAGEFFDYRIRLTFFAQYPAVKLSYRWMNDRGASEFSQFDSIRLELPLADGGAQVLLGAEEPVAGTAAEAFGLVQLRDNAYSGAGEGRRASGWIATDALTLACADFWQLYPKGIGAESGALYLDICPDFADGEYDDCTERELYKLYYYLQDGLYKIRQGTSKIHEVWLDTSGTDGDTLAALASEPPVLAAEPQWYSESGAFGDYVSRTAGSTPRYDEVCDRALNSYIARRESVQEFGMLNYGDQWGERGANWSNGEYDHHHTAAQMFVREATYPWHQLMRAMARHDVDVDLCHWFGYPGREGGSWTHSIGHVGSYVDRMMEDQYGSPRAGQSPTHTWTRGTCEYFMLTGDPTAIEAARMISDHYGGAYINNYDFTNGRVPGWHLIATMATYRTTADPFYLNAARIIVDRALERRTPGSGWERQLVPGHCHCEPRCRGACSFMQGILGVGLREYWLETGDKRVEEAIPDAARYVIEQMWADDAEMFRYTSCPESSLSGTRAASLGGLMLFAWELSGDALFADVATRSLNVDFDRLTSLSQARWTPYIVHAMTRIEQLHQPGLGGERGALILLRNESSRPVQVRLFDRDGHPAPAGAAELVAPDGASLRPDADGRIMAPEAAQGIYSLRLSEGAGSWQVSCSVNPMVISLEGGLEVEVPEAGTRLVLHPMGEYQRSIDVAALDGHPSWRLLSPEGDEIRPEQARADGPYALELAGPGRIRLSAEGWSTWAALHEGRWFNASAPEVLIEGKTAFSPGEGRTVQLAAVVRDFDDDLRNVHWLLPDGSEVEGERLVFEAPEDTTRLQVRAIARDEAGNVGEATVTVRLPEPELAAEGAVTAQAEDFSAQGDGEVSIVSRIGNVGRMITMWHANLGHWLEWTVDVPADGDYVIYARYATQSDEAVRSLTIDGQSPGAAREDLRFASTGGFCTVEDNWAVKRLGEPVHLTAGKHVIRMTNLAEGLALDYLTLVPAE